MQLVCIFAWSDSRIEYLAKKRLLHHYMIHIFYVNILKETNNQLKCGNVAN